MSRTHRTLDGVWEPCRDPKTCELPIHVDMTVEAAQELPEPFLELLAEAVDPPEVAEDGAKRWYDTYGRIHRDYDLPAIIHTDGTRVWRLHGDEARVFGKPDRVNPDGSMFWTRYGRYHRENGPAVIRADGTQEWWVGGQQTPARLAAEIHETGKSISEYKAATTEPWH